jgi:hypothetical protein
MSKKYSTTFLRRVLSSETRKNMSNKFLSSVLGVILFSLANSSSAQVTDVFITCPNDVIIECGQNINDVNITGAPTVEALVGVGYTFVNSDVTISTTNCQTVIARTWTALLNELGFPAGSVSCTQIITVRDTQGPVISGVTSPINVQCLSQAPGVSSGVTAVDACSGPEAVTSFQSAAGTPLNRCNLTTALGLGADWSFWLEELHDLGYTSSDYFNFVAPGGTLEEYADSTAHIFGTIANSANPNERFVVDMWLHNKRGWIDWSTASPLGRSYKNDLDLACADNNHTFWSYYELVDGFSTLTGQGDLAGDQLYLSHLPTNYYYGFQVGEVANNKNCNNGISGWFSFDGFMNNTFVHANGDINCDADCEPQEGACPNRTTAKNLYRAVDDCGRATVVTQTINVFDNIAPSFNNCPADVTIDCDQPVPAVATNISATDNCTSAVTITYLGEVPSGNACNRLLTRTWEAEDECGNRSQCVQVISIVDDEGPVLNGTPSANITVPCDNIPAPATVTATDNCDTLVTVNYSQTTIAGNCAGNYTIRRTWSAADDCQNTTTFVQTIAVIDTVGPVFDAFPIYISSPCDVNPPAPTATDNCSGVTVTIFSDVLNSGGCIGVLTRTYRATDGCGNFTDAIQFITLEDNTRPNLNNVPNEDDVECSSISQGSNGNYFGIAPVTATDNCDDDVQIFYDEDIVLTNDSCDASFDIIRTWIALDDCDNADTATQVVHVVDTTDPYFIDFPENDTINCDETLPMYDMPTAGDNCSAVTITYVGMDTINGNCPQSYTIIRTFRANDQCGNQAIEFQTILVRDTEAPDFGNDDQSEFTYECGETVPVIQPTATDNCGAITYTYVNSQPTGSTCDRLTIRTWTAEDECGNASTFVQYIHVVDTTAPVISGDTEIERPCDNAGGNYITIVEVCSNYTVQKTDQFVSGGCAGTLIRTYVVTDACGNASAPFTQFIHLTDETAPTAFGFTPSITVSCGTTIPGFNPQWNDNCDDDLTIIALPDSIIEGNCPAERTIIRRVKAIDSCDNEAIATQTVNVDDNVGPGWTTASPDTLTYQCGTTPPVVQPVATDNCSTITYDYTDGPETVVGCNPRFTRTWIATDACGNPSLPFQQLITFVDTIAPVIINCPNDIELECDESLPAVAVVNATDNCDDNVSISYTQHYFGDQPTPGVLASCNPSTPTHASGGVCGINVGGVDIDWAMQLNSMPVAYRYYELVEGNLVRTADNIHFTATMVNVLDPTSGFYVDVNFTGGYDYTTWSSGMTSYKADCVPVGNNYQDWLYFLLQNGEGAELTGFGGYAGSLLNLTHAPSNNYYAFQYGAGANNFNANFGFGGWFNYNGTFVTSPTAAPSQQFGAGDFSLDLDCCPDFWVVRQWTAIDCSGNSTTCSQIISYEGTNPTVNTGLNLPEVLTPAIDENERLSDVDVAPNPVRNIAQFSFKTINTATTTLEIFDMSGRKVADVYSGVVEAGNAYQVSFDTEALATGIYMYRFTNGSDVQIKRLIINK